MIDTFGPDYQPPRPGNRLVRAGFRALRAGFRALRAWIFMQLLDGRPKHQHRNKT